MIEVNNLTSRKINEKTIKKVAEITLIGENINKGDLSIVFSGEKRIKELNKRFRKKNKATDVLSFGRSDNFLKEDNQLGEIIICPQFISRNADNYEKEIKRALIHGILHLLGYDHEKSEKERLEMNEKENYYLSKIINTYNI